MRISYSPRSAAIIRSASPGRPNIDAPDFARSEYCFTMVTPSRAAKSWHKLNWSSTDLSFCKSVEKRP
ncbi:hypothetical protein ATY75_03240 [Rhizobium sp. N122]|nr:hypothetical protein ATY75_03240 [Rhizobium sp. N122]